MCNYRRLCSRQSRKSTWASSERSIARISSQKADYSVSCRHSRKLKNIEDTEKAKRRLAEEKAAALARAEDEEFAADRCELEKIAWN